MEHQEIDAGRFEQGQQVEDLFRVLVPGAQLDGKGPGNASRNAGITSERSSGRRSILPPVSPRGHAPIRAAHVEVEVDRPGRLRGLGGGNQRFPAVSDQLHHQGHAIFGGARLPQVARPKAAAPVRPG